MACASEVSLGCPPPPLASLSPRPRATYDCPSQLNLQTGGTMESAQPATSQQAAEEAASSSSNPSLAATRESPTAAQSSFKILPRPSPPPPPPATPSTSQLQDSPNATARAPRASSEGRGITATTRSAAATEATYRRTGSESALTSRNHSSAMELAPDDEQVITPRSSSPELSSSAAGNSEGGSVGPRSTQATEATDETVPPPQLDSVLLLALAQPRDRILLLRAEAEIERFLATPT